MGSEPIELTMKNATSFIRTQTQWRGTFHIVLNQESHYDYDDHHQYELMLFEAKKSERGKWSWDDDEPVATYYFNGDSGELKTTEKGNRDYDNFDYAVVNISDDYWSMLSFLKGGEPRGEGTDSESDDNDTVITNMY
jgi:hypothetical protein